MVEAFRGQWQYGKRIQISKNKRIASSEVILFISHCLFLKLYGHNAIINKIIYMLKIGYDKGID